MIQAAVEHRRERGEHPCLLDLVARLPTLAPADVARCCFDAIRKGAASYRFAPVWRSGRRMTRKTEKPPLEIMEKSARKCSFARKNKRGFRCIFNTLHCGVSTTPLRTLGSIAVLKE